MAKIQTAQPKFKILVANIAGAGDPSRGINPTKIRTGFEQQMIPEIGRGATPSRITSNSTPGISTRQGLIDYTTPGVPVASSGTVLVGSNVFTAAATLLVGPFTVTSGVDFTVGGSTALTATALAAAIDGLPGFAAAAVDSTVTITGPVGLEGNMTQFLAVYRGAVANYTLTPSNGFFSGDEPIIGPPTILP